MFIQQNIIQMKNHFERFVGKYFRMRSSSGHIFIKHMHEFYKRNYELWAMWKNIAPKIICVANMWNILNNKSKFLCPYKCDACQMQDMWRTLNLKTYFGYTFHLFIWAHIQSYHGSKKTRNLWWMWKIFNNKSKRYFPFSIW